MKAQLVKLAYTGVMNVTGQIRALGAALLLALACLPAGAETVHTTHFSSYDVSGRSPVEIYRAILKRGPDVNGGRAIAATTAQAVQSHKLEQGPSSCRITQFRLTFRFHVLLPRLVNASAVTPQDRFLWRQFSDFLKAHELQHTRLWLRCGKELERQVMALRSSSCEDLQRQADRTWQRMKPTCDKQQVNFDRQQRDVLTSQPFMQQVFRGN